MKILITGATGNIGKGLIPLLAGHGRSLVLSDLPASPDESLLHGFPYIPCDVQHGVGLERAAIGCDMLIHLPAWHGIHWREKTEIDYWKLNIEGTFWAFQAAQSAGIKKVVFLSSQAWHGHYDKYGFTKRIGEEVCEYNRRNHGIGYVAVRPADLTPFGNDYLNRFGAGFLYGRVHRDDVLQSIVQSVKFLETTPGPEAPGVIVDAVRKPSFTAKDIENWESDPLGCAEAIWPGSRALIEKYGIQIQRKPHVIESFLGWEEVGYQPQYDFGSFLNELRDLESTVGEDEVRRKTCEY